MCFVLDVNSFHSFFDAKCIEHEDFKPLHDWLYINNGVKMVYGGTVFISEILKLKKYLKYLSELKKASKIAKINTDMVDEMMNAIIAKVNDKDFDDPHIIALMAVSGCLIFASLDQRADRFVKRKDLYPKNTPRRSIYRTKDHVGLLIQDNIVNLQNIIP